MAANVYISRKNWNDFVRRAREFIPNKPAWFAEIEKDGCLLVNNSLPPEAGAHEPKPSVWAPEPPDFLFPDDEKGKK